jgi:hypothetical protein
MSGEATRSQILAVEEVDRPAPRCLGSARKPPNFRGGVKSDMQKISEHGLLEVLADFDELGGASPGLVAWELFVTEQEVREAWAFAVAAGWLAPAGRDQVYGEQLWRLTGEGWNARATRR